MAEFKDSKRKFTVAAPRASHDYIAHCHANPILFGLWEELPKAVLKEFEINGPIPCEGGGVPGDWCGGCRFGRIQMKEFYG